jgi:hypothetical protein
MTREEFYTELHEGIVERFQKLSVEEQNIMRKNSDSAYVHVAKKVIGHEVFSGIPHLRSLELQTKYLEDTNKDIRGEIQ